MAAAYIDTGFAIVQPPLIDQRPSCRLHLLEQKLQRQLILPWKVLLLRTDCSVAGPGAGLVRVHHAWDALWGIFGRTGVWSAKDWSIGCIECLRLEVQLGCILDGEALADGELGLLRPRLPDPDLCAVERVDEILRRMRPTRLLRLVDVAGVGFVRIDEMIVSAVVNIARRNANGVTSAILEDPVKLPVADRVCKDTPRVDRGTTQMTTSNFKS